MILVLTGRVSTPTQHGTPDAVELSLFRLFLSH